MECNVFPQDIFGTHTECLGFALQLNDVYRESLLRVAGKTCLQVNTFHVYAPTLVPCPEYYRRTQTRHSR
jgi:hypothetical protein